jgi:hypothetical protein
MGGRNIRELALRLHGLNSSDQKWILAELPDRQASSLRELLDELKILGIPTTGSWMPNLEISNSVVDKFLGNKAAYPLDNAHKLNLIPADVVKNVLAKEPVILIAHLIMIQSWSWTKALTKNLTPLKKQQLDFYLENKMAAEPILNKSSLVDKVYERSLLELEVLTKGKSGTSIDGAGNLSRSIQLASFVVDCLKKIHILK